MEAVKATPVAPVQAMAAVPTAVMMQTATATQPPAPIMGGAYHSSLCQYCCDSSICCAALCCDCCVYGAIQTGLKTGKLPQPCDGCGPDCMLHFIICAIGFTEALPCLTCSARKEIRRKYDMPAQDCSDCMEHCFCCCCALCRDYKELEMRMTKQ